MNLLDQLSFIAFTSISMTNHGGLRGEITDTGLHTSTM